MNLRRLILLVGAVVLVVGVIGLLLPVSVPGPDNGSIGCGNAIAADQSAAQQADNHRGGRTKLAMWFHRLDVSHIERSLNCRP